MKSLTIYLSTFFKNTLVKKLLFVISLSFILFTLVIIVNPQPFLKLGYIGILTFNIFSTGLIIFPILIKSYNLFELSFICSAGMCINESINWIMGKTSESIIKESKYEKTLEIVIKKYDIFAIFILALIPFPFDIVGIIAGRLNISFTRFILPIFFARTVRFIIYGLILIYGFNIQPD